MIIVSQNQKIVINVNNIIAIYNKKISNLFSLTVRDCTGQEISLGTYSTKAEVTKILSNIISRLSTNDTVFQVPDFINPFCNFQLLTKEQLNEIADNYLLTEHGRKSLQKRGILESNIAFLIRNSTFAYFNQGYFYVAINDYECFVISKEEVNGKICNKIITFLEKSNSGKSVKEKYETLKSRQEN